MDTPILFIHGFGGYREQYLPMMKYLRQRGINNFYEFNYDNKFGFSSIRVVAKELAEFMDEKVKEEDINIIAMSQGGVIALEYLKDFKNKNVEKLFTLCTPHKGSKLAKIFNLPGIVEMWPKSDFLKNLETFSRDNAINLYSVYTPFDLMVFPGWNARSKYGRKKIVFAPTHPAVFSWPATAEFIYKNLIR